MTRPPARRARALACVATLALAASACGMADDRPARSDADAGRPKSSTVRAWRTLAPSPLERTEVGAARIGDRVYVVGGFISSGGTTGKLAIYRISKDRWSRGRSLPIAVNHAGVTALRGRLYLLGGFLAGRRGDASARLYRYTPARDRWRRLEDAPTARGALGLVGIGRRLYAAGGATEGNDRLRRLEIYDTKRRRWTVGAKMPTGRNHVAAAVLKRTMIVTGGRPGPVHGNLATVESYDARRDRWQRLPSMRAARSGHAAVTTRAQVVAFGGEELDGGTTIADAEAFDAASFGWRALPPMQTPRHGLGGAARRGRVFALEGGPQPGLSFSNAVEFLDIPWVRSQPPA